MRILLIAANTRAQAEPSLGIGYLASYLKKYSDIVFDIKILNYMPTDISKIVRYSPDIIGISALTKQYRSAILFARSIKEHIDVPIILGGHHISIVPESLDKVFDAAVLTEGEQTFLELIEYFYTHGTGKKGLKKIDGLEYFDGSGRRTVTKARSLIEPLDKIPYPNRDLYNMEFILNEKKNVFGLSFGRGTHMFTSRGCPFKCVFCSATNFWQKIRYNSPEYVVGELNELIEKYDVRLVHIYDDLFIANKERLRAIVELIEAEGIDKKVEFGMFGRADIFDAETAGLLKRMNTVFVEFGIESGTQRILDFLKGGRVTTQKVEKAVSLCKENGIKTGGTFIIGSPGETEKEMLQTLKFIKKLDLDKFSFFTLNPYPGTPLWDYAVTEGILPEKINWDTFEMKRAHGLAEDDITSNTGQILIDKSITPKRFVEVFKLFEREREKLYDFKWEEVIPKDEPDTNPWWV
jgi:anaerobic magnesium-protoporphyrin IX monomethyl ester cyclase